MGTMTNTATKIITVPAESGTCMVVGCERGADFKSQSLRGPNTFTVSLACFEHASRGQLDAMLDL